MSIWSGEKMKEVRDIHNYSLINPKDFEYTLLQDKLILIGVTATVGQLLMTAGYKYLPVKIASILGQFEAVLSFAFGILIFKEFFNVYFLVGAVLIVFSSALALLQKGETLVQKTADRIGVID